MLSAYTSYSLQTRDLQASLKRVASDSMVAREAAYYKENIGKVRSVDDLMNDYRLYNYVVKAHGLEEMAYAKAFIRQVLESDLNDPKSLANRLTDTRYLTLAAAFDFGNRSASPALQSEAQQDALVAAYYSQITNHEKQQKAETDYYISEAVTISNVDDIFRDTALRDYIYSAFAIDGAITNEEQLKKIIASDPADPASHVNATYGPKLEEWQLKIDDLVLERQQPGLSSTRKEQIDYLITSYQKFIGQAENYFKLASAFSFNPDGTPIDGVPAQNNDQILFVAERFVSSSGRLDETGATLNYGYFTSKIDEVQSVGDLTADSRLKDMLIVAFGLPKYTTTTGKLEWALTQDPSDPDSPIHAEAPGFVALARAFNFSADGTLADGISAMSAEQQNTMMSAYFERYDDEYEAADEKTVNQYKKYVGLVSNLSDFLSASAGSTAVRSFALQAFDIGPNELSLLDLRKILTSDINDRRSFVNSLKDDRFLRLAKAFNFNTDGTIGTPLLAQPESEITRLSKAYLAEKTKSDTNAAAKTKAEDETKYYREQIERISSVSELLSNKRLVSFMLTAEGIDPAKVKLSDLEKMFKSDLNDPKSFVNQLEDQGFRLLVASFNFGPDGKISESAASVQTRRTLMSTQDMYLRQTLEEQVGEENEGARLALYFQRMAPTIKNVYEILSDTAIAKVVRTMFGLPDEIANGNIDMQANVIKKNLDLADLKDPEKVEKLISRFLAFYEMENGAPDPVLMAFQAPGEISADTLTALALLRTRR
ncbi:DUF1217 domain-containing protein [Pseudorhizobium flavum]|uniref:DUF1217 domain-containing protein n=1 Tax=Pseudorhizobium flavum TaxID=1335061 RepID=A0A7W9Z2V1_9HYPH|nr:DUF1217 domain-containing protein [Pseudorhizobium flavum]MBB6182146.1 hypothetical protein [Pseudorhizobium flavum]CAD6631984.1 hypothetical protein RFYW14_04573 [Pseudorhizobium flavum]